MPPSGPNVLVGFASGIMTGAADVGGNGAGMGMVDCGNPNAGPGCAGLGMVCMLGAIMAPRGGCACCIEVCSCNIWFVTASGIVALSSSPDPLG